MSLFIFLTIIYNFQSMESILGIHLLWISIASIPLIYWYFTRNYNYWSKRGIKGPRPLPGVGTLFYQFMRPRQFIEYDWLKKYGKIYGIYTGKEPALVVGEPAIIRDILVKDFNIFADKGSHRRVHPIISKSLQNVSGDDWKRIRSIVSPTFTSGKMKKMFPMIKDCLAEFLQSLETYANTGKDFDAKEMFGKYSMDGIATCAFATKTNAYKESDNPFIRNVVKVFSPNYYRQMAYTLLPKPLLQLLGVYTLQDEAANQFFFELTRHIINERKGCNKKYNDFIDLVMNEVKEIENREEAVVRDVNDSNESHHVNEGEEELKLEKRLYNSVSKKYITEDEIIAQAFVFFIAGYESTATTLTFVAYELALNQDIQERLHEEVMTAVDANGDIDYDLLSSLPYLDSVLSETLRLHPPSIFMTRIASEEYKLGTTGITLSKGQLVTIPVFAMHRMEEFYEEPLKFNPDRFMPENKHKIKPYTYLPFGGGPRNCVGMRFALMEAKVCLAQLVRRFKLSKSPKTDIPLKLKLRIGVNSPERMILTINKRV